MDILEPSVSPGRVRPAVCRPVLQAPGANLLRQTLAIMLPLAGPDMTCARARRRQTLRLRHMAIYLSHFVFGLSQRQVAGLFHRDRTTIRYICARIENMRDDLQLDYMLTTLEAALLAFTKVFSDDHSETENEIRKCRQISFGAPR